MQQPCDRPALMRLLGMVQYMAKFVPHFSEITVPCKVCLLKTPEFSWTDTHSKALYDLKQLLVSAPTGTLGYYDVMKPIKIQTDASSSGLGCVCMQDGKPIEKASRALTPDERIRIVNSKKNSLLFAGHYLAIIFIAMGSLMSQ